MPFQGGQRDQQPGMPPRLPLNPEPPEVQLYDLLREAQSQAEMFLDVASQPREGVEGSGEFGLASRDVVRDAHLPCLRDGLRELHHDGAPLRTPPHRMVNEARERLHEPGPVAEKQHGLRRKF